jgi:hypothetical protein
MTKRGNLNIEACTPPKPSKFNQVMDMNTIFDEFTKCLATLLVVGVFILFVLTIFGVFNVAAVLG